MTPPDPVPTTISPATSLLHPGGVPAVVWHAAPGPEALSPQLAKALLRQHTRRGDVVVDVNDDVAFAAAAAETARRHHALGGGHRLAALGDAAGYVDLVLLHWPRPAPGQPPLATRGLPNPAAPRHRRPRRRRQRPPAQRISHLTALTGAAHAVGLRQVRHVAVVDPDATPGCRSRPGSAEVAPPGLDDATVDRPSGHIPAGAGHGVGGLAPHTDLLIFAAEEGHHG